MERNAKERRVPEAGEAGSYERCMGRGAQVSCSTFRNWVPRPEVFLHFPETWMKKKLRFCSTKTGCI